MVRLRRSWREGSWSEDCSKGGWRTGDLLSAVRRRGHTFNFICVVLVAINDILSDIPVSKIQSNLKSIITFLTRLKRIILICTIPPPLYSTQSQKTVIFHINKFILSFSNKANIRIISLHKQFPPYVPLNKELYQLYCRYGKRDGLHLSYQGHQVLIRLIKEATQETFPSLVIPV